MRTPRTTRLLCLTALSAAAFTAVAVSSATSAAAGTSARHPARAITVTGSTSTSAGLRYARVVPVCDRPKPGESRCMALRWVPVPAGTSGARAYRSSAADNGAGPAAGFTPRQIAGAYRVNTAGATTQTVAIVDAYADPYARSELNTFDRRYRLPLETAISLRIVNQRGRTTGLPRADASWATEIALDLQAVRGLCNKCRILLVEADSASGVSLAATVDTAVRMGARIVSNSYGAPETYSTRAIQAAYNRVGVLITASTGDDGWYSWDYANDPVYTPGTSDNEPSVPAAYPSVVAVGGTALTLNANGTRRSETVWNENGPTDATGLRYGTSAGATGGGCSTLFTVSAAQLRVAGFASLGCGGHRMTGDIAAVADPATGYDIYSVYYRGWVTFGGTSLSAPIIAALSGLAGGPRGVPSPAQTLYNHSRTTYDVTRGGNAFCGSDTKATCAATVSSLTGGATRNPNNLANQYGDWMGLVDCGFAYNGGTALLVNDKQCIARTGFDGPTGIGTPNGLTTFRP